MPLHGGFGFSPWAVPLLGYRFDAVLTLPRETWRSVSAPRVPLQAVSGRCLVVTLTRIPFRAMWSHPGRRGRRCGTRWSASLLLLRSNAGNPNSGVVLEPLSKTLSRRWPSGLRLHSAQACSLLIGLELFEAPIESRGEVFQTSASVERSLGVAVQLLMAVRAEPSDIL
jgi:hypothetical protein